MLKGRGPCNSLVVIILSHLQKHSFRNIVSATKFPLSAIRKLRLVTTTEHQPSPGPPTIRDVARAAGVSVSTASKALNDQGQLRPETRHKVRAAAEQLGYFPNDLFLSLRRKRSFTVGLVASYGRFSLPMLEGIEDTLAAAEISVFLCYASDPNRESRHVRSLLSKRVDGLIVTSDRTDPRPPFELGHSKVPILYAYTQSEAPGALSVLPDDPQGARLATEHLTGLGRQRIAHITGPAHFWAARERAKSYLGVLREAGLSPAARVRHGPWSEEWGREAALDLLRKHPDLDALFCGNDQIARGVSDSLRDLGVRVPDDVSIVGFDNWADVAQAARPPLTTIDMNIHDLGRLAGQKLLELIDGHPETGVLRQTCSLVVRDSCGATRSKTRAAKPGGGGPPLE